MKKVVELAVIEKTLMACSSGCVNMLRIQSTVLGDGNIGIEERKGGIVRNDLSPQNIFHIAVLDMNHENAMPVAFRCSEEHGKADGRVLRIDGGVGLWSVGGKPDQVVLTERIHGVKVKGNGSQRIGPQVLHDGIVIQVEKDGSDHIAVLLIKAAQFVIERNEGLRFVFILFA